MFSRNMILQGRVAVDGYREAHRQLHTGGWHKGIEEEHTPLLNTMLQSLKKTGFDSLEEYFIAEKPYQDEFIREDFEAQAIQREVRLIDLRESGHVYNLAAQEVIQSLNMEGVSPDTLIITHSEVEPQIGIHISQDSDASSELDIKGVEEAKVVVVRSQYSGFKPCLLSPTCIEPLLVSNNLYNEETGFVLWQEIMRQVWALFGITVDAPSTKTNDLTVNGKKLTGLWVGTNFISAMSCLDLDFSLAETFTVPLAGVSHPILSISERMTTARIEAGRTIDFTEFFDVFKGVLETVLHLTFVLGHLTVAEEKRIANYLSRYQSAEWTWHGEFNGD